MKPTTQPVVAHIWVGQHGLDEYNDNSMDETAAVLPFKDTGYVGMQLVFNSFDWRGGSCAKVTATADGFQIISFCVTKPDKEPFSVYRNEFQIFNRRPVEAGGQVYVGRKLKFLDPERVVDGTPRGAYTTAERQELGYFNIKVERCKHTRHNKPNARLETLSGCSRDGAGLSKEVLEEQDPKPEKVIGLFPIPRITDPLSPRLVDRCSCKAIDQSKPIEFAFRYMTHSEFAALDDDLRDMGAEEGEGWRRHHVSSANFPDPGSQARAGTPSSSSSSDLPLPTVTPSTGSVQRVGGTRSSDRVLKIGRGNSISPSKRRARVSNQPVYKGYDASESRRRNDLDNAGGASRDADQSDNAEGNDGGSDADESDDVQAPQPKASQPPQYKGNQPLSAHAQEDITRDSSSDSSSNSSTDTRSDSGDGDDATNVKRSDSVDLRTLLAPDISNQEEFEIFEYQLKWQEMQVLAIHNADARKRDADARKRDSDMRKRDRRMAESVARTIAAQHELVELARARLKRKREAEDTEDESSDDESSEEESSGDDGPGSKRSKGGIFNSESSDDELLETEELSNDGETSDGSSPEGSEDGAADDAGPVFRKLEAQEWHNGPWAEAVTTHFPEHVPDVPNLPIRASPGHRSIKLQQGSSH